MQQPAVQMHTERLLDLTNAMLLAAIEGRLDELKHLEQQRECVYAKLLPGAELGDPDVLRLADALTSISLADEIICHLTADECPAAATCGRARAAAAPAQSPVPRPSAATPRPRPARLKLPAAPARSR